MIYVTEQVYTYFIFIERLHVIIVIFRAKELLLIEYKRRLLCKQLNQNMASHLYT